MINYRIANLFKYQKAFIAYLTAGDGGIKKTLDAALALIDGGVNMLEIGVPFTDPIADGPVIQQAAMRALAAGTSLEDVLWLITEIRKRSEIPLILFSYYNPILKALTKSFINTVKMAGIDGILIVDCPLDEMGELHNQCQEQAIAPIGIITPSTPNARMQKIEQLSSGFLYYACRAGTTGLRTHLPSDFDQKIKTIKTQVTLPMVVGFGISEPTMASQVLECADGVVIGSLFVKALAEGMPTNALSLLAQRIFGAT